MGAALGLLASEGVDEYMSCQDAHSAIVNIGEQESNPRTFRLRSIPTDMLRSSEGTAAGRVAHTLVAYAAAKLGLDVDVSAPSVCCTQTGLSNIMEHIHQGVDVRSLKVPKDARSVCWCISRGFPVAASVPVTIDVTEKRLEPPKGEGGAFAIVPIVLWGYSTVTQKFAAYVPLHAYDEGTVVHFDHVLHEDSCDFYTVDIHHVQSADMNDMSSANGSDSDEEEEVGGDTSRALFLV